MYILYSTVWLIVDCLCELAGGGLDGSCEPFSAVTSGCVFRLG